MLTREEAVKKAQIIDFQGGYTIELVSKIYDDFEEKINEAIIEIEDAGWMTYEDKQTCIDILYKLKDNA